MADSMLQGYLRVPVPVGGGGGGSILHDPHWNKKLGHPVHSVNAPLFYGLGMRITQSFIIVLSHLTNQS